MPHKTAILCCQIHLRHRRGSGCRSLVIALIKLVQLICYVGLISLIAPVGAVRPPTLLVDLIRLVIELRPCVILSPLPGIIINFVLLVLRDWLPYHHLIHTSASPGPLKGAYGPCQLFAHLLIVRTSAQLVLIISTVCQLLLNLQVGNLINVVCFIIMHVL